MRVRNITEIDPEADVALRELFAESAPKFFQAAIRKGTLHGTSFETPLLGIPIEAVIHVTTEG